MTAGCGEPKVGVSQFERSARPCCRLGAAPGTAARRLERVGALAKARAVRCHPGIHLDFASIASDF